MPASKNPSPLAVAALAFVEGGVDPSAVMERFESFGASVSEPAARALLDELCALGLARVVPGKGGHGHYFTTPLGERLRDASFVGRPEHADLLADIEHMRTELLSTIAHELRTPLTAIRTSAGLLSDPAIEPSAEQHRTLLDTINRNATRMQRVVGDILDLARFRAGRVQLQLRRFDAVELARSAIASIELLGIERRQVIDLDAPGDRVWLFGDYRRLEQALVNLLSNAEKYSPEGAPIKVTVAAMGPEVMWKVADRGRGIAPDHRPRLFERFFVADEQRSEATTGIGLGLPISLLIVQAHDGRIEVESEPGHGSTFTVIVPAAGPREIPDE